MCERYTLRQDLSKVAEKLGNYELEPNDLKSHEIEARYNIAPTQRNIVLRKSFTARGLLQVSQLRWGLVPSWSKTPQTQSPLINADLETVAEMPPFRAAFQRRRCLIPADGFYEWQNRKGVHHPYFFSMADDSVFFMAGIWETWIGKNNECFDSYTILTTHANKLLAKYHERMPAILTEDRLEHWLEADMANLETSQRNKLFAPVDPKLMTCRPANPIVNNDRSEGPECLTAPEQAQVPQLDLGL